MVTHVYGRVTTSVLLRAVSVNGRGKDEKRGPKREQEEKLYMRDETEEL